MPAPTVPAFHQRLLDLVGALRQAGVTVAIAEDIEAVRTLAHLDLLDREQLREALAATLVKTHTHRGTFDELFDLYFPVRPARIPQPTTEGDDDDPEGFLRELLEQLMAGDEGAIRRLARLAVDRFGRAEGREGRDSWFQYRVFRAIDLQALLQELLRRRAEEHGAEPSALQQRLWRDEFEARLRALREEVEVDIRRRYAEQRGVEEIADRLIRAPLEERDFFRLSPQEQAELQTQIRPLARRLATRLAVRRRRGREGRLDVRRTVRHSLSTGGVPFDPVFRPRHPHKPELFVLCDISGSVAAFARFTLLLVHTLQDQFSKVRSFAFVDTLDEVTRLFDGGEFADGIRRMSTEADVVWFDGHSDYGHSLEVFHRRFARDVTPRSSLLILGDARNNYRQANEWVLQDLHQRARRLLWLNPEQRAFWDTGDSIASRYARFTDDMAEVRNLKQLATFVERVS